MRVYNQKMEEINNSISKTKYKVLFYSMLYDSDNRIKVSYYYNNGLKTKAVVCSNTIQNKLELKI